MYLTDLAVAVKKSGLTVHEVSGWKNRGHGSFHRVAGVVCHHTGSKQNGTNLPTLNTLIFGRSDLPGPLCNLGLGRDGSVYIVAAGVAWHAGAGQGFGLPRNEANEYTIGIEAESAGTGDWTAAQLRAYPLLVRALADHYGFPISMVIGHLEWAPTRKIDPHGWPGGMAGLRASAKKNPQGDDDDMAVKTLKGGATIPTQLVANEARTLAVSENYYSMVKGPGRVTGVVSVYLTEPSKCPVRVEAYTVKPDGKGGWVFATGNGLAEYAPGLQHLRYELAMDVPAGYLLRVRATPLGADSPLVAKAGFNLDVRN